MVYQILGLLIGNSQRQHKVRFSQKGFEADLFDFFTPKDQGLGEVVAVTYNGTEMIGFITQTDEKKLPESFRGQDKVLVYLPMSYMIGGFTVFIPREHVRPIKMSMEEAMRFVLTAGITGKDRA